MYKVILLPLAKEDIREAAKWYNKQQEGLGKRFTAEVRKKVHFIRQNPKASEIRYKNIRSLFLNVFPFIIHYTINEASMIIIISAVLHTSRNPMVFRKR